MRQSTLEIRTERPRIEELFAPYREAIGYGNAEYRNQVYRTVTCAMHFIDNDSEAQQAVETAFPNEGFHQTLLRPAKDDGGSTLIGGIRVTRGSVKW